MHLHLRARRKFEWRGIASRREDSSRAQPLGAGKLWPGTMYFGDKCPRIVPIARPAGADQHDVARADFGVRCVQMVRRHDKILRQYFQPDDLRNINEHATPEDRRDCIDRVPLEARYITLHVRDVLSAKELSITREVAERVDMRAHVRAQRNRLRSRAAAAGIHIIAVLLVQPVEKARKRRMVRHPCVIRLREINHTAVLNGGEKIVYVGHETSVPARYPKNFRCRFPFSWNTKASESKSARSTSRTIGWRTGRSGSGLSSSR